METKRIQELISSTYSENEYPALVYQTGTWKQSRLLQGKSILDATPVFRNTLAKHLALIAAGAHLTVGLSDRIAYDEDIVRLIRSCGIPVVYAKDTPIEMDLILDCAASFSQWPARTGYVELTRSGVDIYSRSGKPVFVADAGRIKRIETCLGIGESYFRAMKQLGYSDWKGKKLVVFGSGKVGTGIITYARKSGAEVIVITDPISITEPVIRNASGIIDYRDNESVAIAVNKAYAVVTATGVKNALDNNYLPGLLLHSGALLANMGVEDEYGPAIPTENVLMGKKTLNFILDEPTHLKYIDATMALHNEGAVYLVTHPHRQGTIDPSPEIENSILEISRRNGCISDELDLI